MVAQSTAVLRLHSENDSDNAHRQCESIMRCTRAGVSCKSTGVARALKPQLHAD
jgi:hypothetical protein